MDPEGEKWHWLIGEASAPPCGLPLAGRKLDSTRGNPVVVSTGPISRSPASTEFRRDNARDNPLVG